MATKNTTKFCQTCQRTMSSDQFYTSKNIEKYPPDGKFNECKKCLTRHVNNYDPETYLWILKEVDVPYIKKEWDSILEAAIARNPKKITGMSVLGRYLSKMKLRQWTDYSWADTERLQREIESNITATMRQQGYSEDEIQKVLEQNNQLPERPSIEVSPMGEEMEQNEVVPFFQQESYFEDDLTEEDKKYLSLKWGRNYSPEDWVKLEKLYAEIMESYDIQTATHLDYLILICKASLKSNKLMDIDDIEGSQKMLKTYDTLMKSAKFTAAQDKAEHGDVIDSVGEIVAMCEKDGFIPKFYQDEPKDKIDEVLKDFKLYVSKLIENEPDLISQIEHAVKIMSADDSKKDVEAGSADENLFADSDVMDITDDDFIEHFKLLEEEASEDEEDE